MWRLISGCTDNLRGDERYKNNLNTATLSQAVRSGVRATITLAQQH